MGFKQEYYKKASDKQIGYITFIINRDYHKDLGDFVRGDHGAFLGTLTGQESGDLIKCLMAQDVPCFKFKFWALKKGKEENTMDDEKKNGEEQEDNSEKSSDEPENSGDKGDESKE